MYHFGRVILPVLRCRMMKQISALQSKTLDGKGGSWEGAGGKSSKREE